MVADHSRLPAAEVHTRLREALARLEDAERNAVLWFSEVVRRKLFRDLGYGSIYQYAELELQFSRSKTAQFLRLCDSLKDLPALKRSVARGELPWTKAREVAKVATRKTESRWIREARSTTSRKLESKVRATRKQAAQAVSRNRNQVSLAAPQRGGAPDAARSPVPATDVPMNVNLRMSTEQYARYQALLEAIRKRRRSGDRTELVLAALEQMALSLDVPRESGRTEAQEGECESTPGERKGRVKERNGRAGERNGRAGERNGPPPVQSDRLSERSEFTRVNSRSPYQVIVQQCPDCGAGRIATHRGERELAPRELRTILCDAYHRRPGRRNRTAVPDRLRRAVLLRDRYRCRAAGCGGTGFLAVHHRVPREAGGPNTLENLITLCSPCHRVLHSLEER